MRTASAAAMEIVKATAPALEKHGLEITTAMYARLFQNPEIEAMFGPSEEGAIERLVSGWRVAGAVVGESRACQDRASVLPIEGGVVVVVADGAGGRGGGAQAAEAVIEAVARAVMAPVDPWRAETWVEVLPPETEGEANGDAEVGEFHGDSLLCAGRA